MSTSAPLPLSRDVANISPGNENLFRENYNRGHSYWSTIFPAILFYSSPI